MGTFAALAAGVLAFGLTPEQSAAMATIGGADGPMVLFSSLMMAPELFVPISIIAYLYLMPDLRRISLHHQADGAQKVPRH